MTTKIFNNIKAIAFDLDGTLVDSVIGLADALDQALVEHNYPSVGRELVSIWIGNGADIMIERALTWLNVDITPELQQKVRTSFDKYYATCATTGSLLFPQVKETLAELVKQTFRLAIVTNKPTQFILPLLKKLAINDYFLLILGGDDVKKKKPHPAPLYLTMGTFGLRKEELLFVGDSRNDIIAAQAAGCPSVGMTYGYNYGESITLSNPDCVLAQFSDLLPAVGLLSSKN